MKEKRLFDLSIGKGQELLLALQNAGLSANQAKKIIIDPEYAKEWINQLPNEIVDRFANYAKLLFPISKQAKILCELNKQVPSEFQISDSEFKNLDTTSCHIQRYEDLEFLLISLGDFNKTQELIREQAKITHGIWYSHRFQFQSDEGKLRLHETAANFIYIKPGIYRLRINLADNWEPTEGRSVDQIWENDLKSGKKLNAGSLGDAALNVQDRKLRPLQDGINLPYYEYADIIGYNDGHPCFPHSEWDNYKHELNFYLSSPGYVSTCFSTPILVE